VAAPTADRAELEAEIAKYRKAVEENPASRYFAPLADALRRKGELKEALAVAEAGIKHHPKYLSGIVVLAQILKDDGRHERALELFQQALRMNPENIAAQKGLAEIYDHLGDHQNALRAYSAITLLDPRDVGARERLAILEATSPQKTAPKLKAEDEEIKRELTDKSPRPEGQEIKSEQAEEKPASPETPETPPPPETEEIEDQPPLQSTPPLAEDLKPVDPEELAEPEPPPASPEPESEPAEPAEDTDEAPPPTEPKTEPPPAESRPPQKATGPKKDATEEDQLDLFFGGADLDRLQPKDTGLGSDGDNASSPHCSEEGDQPEASEWREDSPEDLTISASPAAGELWEQGRHQEALEVLARELRGDPENNRLADEFLAACRTLDLEPEKALLELSGADESGGDAPVAEFWGDDQSAGRPAGEEQKADPPEIQARREEPAADQGEPEPTRDRVQILKSYLGRIKKDKENRP